jgi:hypothetical protein
MSEEEAKEYVSKLADLEEGFGKLITFVAYKKGIRILPPFFTTSDIEKILLWEGSKANEAFLAEYKSILAKRKMKEP